MNYRKISKEIQKKVIEYHEFIVNTRKGWNEEEILKDLPEYLHNEIALSANKKLIEKVYLFNGMDKMFITAVVMNIQLRSFLPNTLICEKGEIGKEMFFISRGKVNIVSDDRKIVYVTLDDGKFFGEMTLVFEGIKRTATVVTKTFCELYVLTKDSFDKISKDFPNQVKVIKEEAEKRKNLNQKEAEKLKEKQEKEKKEKEEKEKEEKQEKEKEKDKKK
jgi:voltage-gated potassium channel